MNEPASAPRGVGILTIVLTLLCWASVPLFVKHFAHSIDAWTSNGWRYGFSALLWAPVLVVGAWRRRLPRGLWRAALVPGLINSAGQIAFVVAHYKIDPGLITFGLRGQMVFVAVGAYLLFPVERPIVKSPGYLLGTLALMLGTAGAVLLGDEPLRGAHAWGIILAVCAGAGFAGYGLAVRKFMHGVNSILAFATICLYTGAAMVLLMLVIGRDAGLEAVRLPGWQLPMLLLSSVIGIALGHVLYYMSIARLGVAVSAGVLQLHPFAVAIGSLFLFREILTGWQWLGGCVAVLGAVLMLSVQGKKSHEEGIDEAPVAIAEGETGS
ncbi:MAG: DMT family transporter [Planctomycetota bacterium]|nr:DMT family transporter [Planctomycetota bacterium]